LFLNQITGLEEQRKFNAIDYLIALFKMTVLLDLYQENPQAFNDRQRYDIVESILMMTIVDPDVFFDIYPENKMSRLIRILSEGRINYDYYELSALLNRYMDLMKKQAGGLLLDKENMHVLKGYPLYKYTFPFAWTFVIDQFKFNIKSKSFKPTISLSLEQALSSFGDDFDPLKRGKDVLELTKHSSIPVTHFDVKVHLMLVDVYLHAIANAAMSIPLKTSTGGIDLNPLDKQLQTKGAVDFSFVPSDLQGVRIDRLTVVVTGIEVLKSLPEFLGIH
jgi:hypothetical protein